MSPKLKQQKPAYSRRSPVIVVMGHIDHGKSTLLDYIRQANVVDSETGGITQAISAYEVTRKDGAAEHKITFIDTPGHEAFSDMRRRGASLADIAILIVSAEEGVKPQTLDALKAIKEQGLSYIVAINKIDRPNANVEMVKQQLAEKEVMVEGYGGTIPWVAISAKTGAGIDELLELLILSADLAELEGDPAKPASGVVLEAKLDPRIGNTAVLIIKNGTLHLGDYLIMDDTASKIKSLCTFTGQAVKELSFSSPALVTGLTKLPSAGAPFQSYSDRKQAEATAAKQKMATKTKTAPTNTATPNSERVTVPIILKTDVTGSLAAVEHILSQLQTDKVELKVVEMGIGPIAENDIKLAGASTASLVLGFNVKATKAALELAEHNQVNIQTFDIIYKLSEWLAEEIKKRTPLVQVETTIGEAKILKIFSVQKSKQVLGGQVQDGKLVEGKVVKILRRGQEIGKGRISELQQQKARIKEVEAGKQFGALIEAKTVIAVGDTIVASDIITQ